MSKIDELAKTLIDGITQTIKSYVDSRIDYVLGVVKELPQPEKPVDGKDGENGRDALDLEILPAIDVEKSYSRGCYALHKGGLWRSFQKTSGIVGWECIVDGLADIAIEQLDDRSFSVVAAKSSGIEIKKEFIMPAMIYRGIYEQGKDYKKGDTTTWNGSTWTCLEDTVEPPNSSARNWQLSVKAGRNAHQTVKVKP